MSEKMEHNFTMDDCYNYAELLAKATAPDATQADINTLGEWFNHFGRDYWDGEGGYRISADRYLYQVAVPANDCGDFDVIGYTFSGAEADRYPLGFEWTEENNDEKKEEDSILILRVPVDYYAATDTIPNTLEKMQELVGGYIEAVRFADGAVLICNEEGKLNGMKPNRALGDRKSAQFHKVDKIVFGDFFITYAAPGSDEFQSLPPALAEKYEKEFRLPEQIIIGREGDTYSKLFLPVREREAEHER